jgi:hypothetical protein
VGILNAVVFHILVSVFARGRESGLQGGSMPGMKCLALAAITVLIAGVSGAEPGNVPAYVGRVNDFAHLLPEGERAALERTRLVMKTRPRTK